MIARNKCSVCIENGMKLALSGRNHRNLVCVLLSYRTFSQTWAFHPKVDLFVAKQGLDTTTPGGRAMFGMMGVFAEFERDMIQERVRSGMARAQAEQAAGVKRLSADGKSYKKLIGRPKASKATEAAIRAELATGVGIGKVARKLGVGVGTVLRVKATQPQGTA